MRFEWPRLRIVTSTVSMCVVIGVLGLATTRIAAQDSSQTVAGDEAVGRTGDERIAEREKLRDEIRNYAALVQAMRESLAVRDRGGQRGENEFLQIENSVGELGEAIGGIAEQLSALELRIGDQRVSVSDGRGGELSLELPENLGVQLSEGLSSLTRAILDEMPDTVSIGSRETGFTWDWTDDGFQIVPVKPPRPTRVIEGGLVKIQDDMVIGANEDVYGDAVAIMGDVLVEGRVRGDLIAVLGDVHLGENAVVDGHVVTILGELQRDDGATAGQVTVVNLGPSGMPTDLLQVGYGWASFWGYQILFGLLLLLVVVLLVLTPRHRLESFVDSMQRRPGECAAVGLLMAIAGHAVVVGLVVILVLTVIGIPVALLLLLGVLLLDLAAVGTSSLMVGRSLCRRWGMTCPHPWRETLLGMAVIHAPAFLAALLGAVSAPTAMVLLLLWIGRVAKLAAFCFGLGALLMSRFGGSRRRDEHRHAIETTVGAPNS